MSTRSRQRSRARGERSAGLSPSIPDPPAADTASGRGGLVVFAFVLLLVTTAPAAGSTWTRWIGVEGHASGRPIVVAHPDGGAVLASHDDTLRGAHYPHLIRLDENGDPLWARVIEVPSMDFVVQVEVAEDGTIFMAAAEYSMGSDASQFWIAKLSAEGELLWDRILHNDWRAHDWMRDLDLFRDGSILFVNATRYGTVLGKISTDGELVWLHAWNPNFAGVAEELPDGRLVTGGKVLGSDDDVPWIGLHDADGNLLEERIVPLEGSFSPTCLELAPGGGFYFGGAVRVAFGDDWGWLGRWTPTLELEWTRRLELADWDVSLDSCFLNESGGLDLGGDAEISEVAGEANHAWWARMHADGSVEWTHGFDRTVGPEPVLSIAAASDGGRYLAIMTPGSRPIVARTLEDGLPRALCPNYRETDFAFVPGPLITEVLVSDPFPNSPFLTDPGSVAVPVDAVLDDVCCPFEYSPLELAPPDGDEWLRFTYPFRFVFPDHSPANGCTAQVSRGLLSELGAGVPPTCLLVTDRGRGDDIETAGLDDGFYYLVSAVNHAREGPVGPTGHSTLGAERPRPAECP